MHQKPYNKDEIIYPNLKIESFTVDKLITYFEQFDTTINNGLLLEEQRNDDKPFLIKIRQYRLNHKPFNFHITINADKPMKAAIRIFIGPKYDSHHKLIEIPEDLKYFYEIDNWMLDCKFIHFYFSLSILFSYSIIKEGIKMIIFTFSLIVIIIIIIICYIIFNSEFRFEQNYT